MVDAPLWRPLEVLAATGGTLHGTAMPSLNGVSIDSRAIAAGDIFVAIKGDQHDGHAFVDKALGKGAGLALVQAASHEMKAAGAVIELGHDPLLALESLGRAARERSKGKVIAVTGSVGKTSTKEMLQLALAASGATHSSVASFNNHWGVPLTLSRFARNASYGIFEIGMNHAGEITPLVGMVKPHVAVVTTIAASHLGHFKSLQEIAEAKSEIFSGIVEGGAAVINRDSRFFDFLAARARDHGIKTIVSFGKTEGSSVRLKQLALHPTCSCITADVMGEDVAFKLGVPGQHMALNSLAVLAAVKLAGADLARACLALAEAAPAKGRGGQEHLVVGGGDVLLLDESYNANPESMAAAFNLLNTAAKGRKGRKIAVLGDMLELGSSSLELHKSLAPKLDEAGIDLIYAAGPMMRALYEAMPTRQHGGYAETSAELVGTLGSSLRNGDSIVIKGSNGSKMALVAEALRRQFPPRNKEN